MVAVKVEVLGTVSGCGFFDFYQAVNACEMTRNSGFFVYLYIIVGIPCHCKGFVGPSS